MKNFKLSIVSLSAVISSSLWGATPPDSSDILRQITPPQLSNNESIIPEIKNTYKPPMKLDSNVKISISSFKITGNKVFTDSELQSLLSSYKNKELTLSDLNKLTNIITMYYRNNGYFLARAYIPVQELTKTDANVEFAVIEGNYGTFSIKNNSNVSLDELQNYLNILSTDKTINVDDLERQILLIDQLSGARITNAEVYPGKNIGTSDFKLTIDKEDKFDFYTIIDNYGNKYTGEYRLNLIGYLNSLTNKGDTLIINSLNSNSGDLNSLGFNYSRPLNYSGLVLNSTMNYTKYEIGEEFENLGIEGESVNFTLGLNYPIIKTRNHTLDTNLNYKFQNTSTEDLIQDDRKKDINSLTLSLNDTIRTNFLNRKGNLKTSLSYTAGNLNLNNYSKSLDVLQTDGTFSKLNFNLEQSQNLNNRLSLKLAFNSQIAFDKNLDGSAEFGVGGPYGVRAYGSSELSGDKGYLTSLELIYNLNNIGNVSHYISTFIDHAKVWANENEVVGIENETRTLNDIGISYNLNYKQFVLKSTFAHGFGSDKTPVSTGSDTNLNKATFEASMKF